MTTIENAPSGQKSAVDGTEKIPVNDDYYILANQINKYIQTSYKISVTVSANDLVVALKHPDDTDPSSTRPLYFKIGSTVRSVIAATSITLADATNWFNAGGAELATKEIDYFLYAVWDSNSSVVAIAPARIPWGRLVSDFSATTTNEKYLGNYANFTSTDDVCVIGRFAATLSAGAGYTWTVPTFTNENLIHEPRYQTRDLLWQPAYTADSGTYNTVTTDFATYSVNMRKVLVIVKATGTTSATPTILRCTLPFEALYKCGGGGFVFDSKLIGGLIQIIAGTPDTLEFSKYDSALTFAAGASKVIDGEIFYVIE